MTAAGAPYHFVDREGREWVVVEELTPREEWHSADEDTHRSGYPIGWLHFACGPDRRRLRLFPKRWRELPAAELERLCDRARPVT